MYINRFVERLNLNISLLFIDEGTQFGLNWLRYLGFPLLFPVKQQLLELFFVYSILFGLIHPLQVLVKALFLVFFMYCSLEFTNSRVRGLNLMISGLRLFEVWLECTL